VERVCHLQGKPVGAQGRKEAARFEFMQTGTARRDDDGSGGIHTEFGWREVDHTSGDLVPAEGTERCPPTSWERMAA